MARTLVASYLYSRKPLLPYHKSDQRPPSTYHLCNSAVEINVGIIAGCLVALPPLFKKHPVGSFRKWSLSSLWSRLFRRTDQKYASSRKQPLGDSFHGVSLHLPTGGGFTGLGNKGTSISERSLEEHEMDRRAAEPFSM
jgi:hypothetical protein